MRLLIVAAIMAISAVQPAKAAEVSGCDGSGFDRSASILYQQQVGFYMGAYDSGAMTMEYMAHRLASYTQRYGSLDAEFVKFLDDRKANGADFAKPLTYVRALGEFLASVDVDMNMGGMCEAEHAKSLKFPQV